MSKKIYIAKQAITNIYGNIYGYELLYRDSKDGIKEFPSNMKASSHVLMSSLTYIDLDELLGKNKKAFINVDSKLLGSGILETLDSKRFVIEILENTILTENLIKKIIKLKSLGFEIAIDDFDGSDKMILNFKPIFKHVNIIKVDAFTMNKENILKLTKKFQSLKINMLIEKVETIQEINEFKKYGFSYFQGYAISKPEIVEFQNYKDAQKLVIMKVISILNQDGETKELENYIKKQPELVINILNFINNQKLTTSTISSIVQAITLLGRAKLSKWLIIYLYSEIDSGQSSKILLETSLARAEEMEALSNNNPEEAFMTGLFSLAGELFDADPVKLLNSIKIDSKIISSIVNKTGINGGLLRQVEDYERDDLKQILNKNFESFKTVDILKLLEKSGIEY